MRISYDSKVDAVYFKFIETPTEVTTQRLSEDIAINYDSKGEIVGIEILSAQEHLKFSGKKPRVTLENLLVKSNCGAGTGAYPHMKVGATPCGCPGFSGVRL